MDASECYQGGDLQGAIAAQLDQVRADPGHEGKRLFLFELLSFAGDLDRAQKQIEALLTNETEHDLAFLTYRGLLDGERARRRLFRDGVAPRFFADPPEHIRLRLEAVARLREKRPAEAAEVLGRAGEAAPVLQGALNDRPFTVLRDCDDLFGTVLEVLYGGSYYWLPLELVAEIALEAPRFPRDVLWAPAKMTFKDGQEGSVFLPALYPNSHEHPDNAVKLGRATDWKATEGGPVLGAGVRDFLVDEEVVSLLEWREMRVS
jgi:type VI secretion system protein ImpE